MPYKDLREHLLNLEKRNLLRRVKVEVDKDWELTSIMRTVIRQPNEDNRYAVWFEKVKGSKLSVAVGVLGANREVYATAMGVSKEKILERWANALEKPLQPKLVSSGAVKENVLTGDQVDLTKLPIPVWTPGKDTSPYIAGAFLVMTDPETGKRNVGTYRMMVKGKNKTGILIVPSQHSGIIYSKWEKLGKPMPVAVCIGGIPTIGMASVAKVPYGVDEFAVAGALNGEPVELVKCETVDLEVPATAEIVIEGEVLPKEREMEGPFGEYTGYMATSGPRPVFVAKCITHRNDAVYQNFISQMPPSESMMIQGIALEALIYYHLSKRMGYPIKDVYATQTSGLSTVAISFTNSYPGIARQILSEAITIHPPYVKTVIGVDEDVDIRDPQELDWAVAFRIQADRDIFLVEKMPSFPLDPSIAPAEAPANQKIQGTKMAIDATKKWPYPEISLPPKELLDKVLKNWDNYKLPKPELK